MSVSREELHRLVDALPEEQVSQALEDVRRRLPPTVAGSWPPPWVGAMVTERSDISENYEDLLAEGFGRS